MGLSSETRLIGHCADDPKIGQTKNGKPKATVVVYTEDWWKDAKTNFIHTNKEYHYCLFFGQNAKRAQDLLMKGCQVHLRGVIRYNRKQENGKTISNPQIWVDEFMNSSKALMTKELYDQIFNEDETTTNTQKENQND